MHQSHSQLKRIRTNAIEQYAPKNSNPNESHCNTDKKIQNQHICSQPYQLFRTGIWRKATQWPINSSGNKKLATLTFRREQRHRKKRANVNGRRWPSWICDFFKYSVKEILRIECFWFFERCYTEYFSLLDGQIFLSVAMKDSYLSIFLSMILYWRKIHIKIYLNLYFMATFPLPRQFKVCFASLFYTSFYKTIGLKN